MEARPSSSGRRRTVTRLPRLATLGAAAALVLSTLTIAQSAQAAGAPSARTVAALQKSWSYVPQYASARTIDQGTVRDAAGHPVAGATVIVFPAEGGKPGTVLQPVARATSDSTGHFAVHLPASRDALLMSRNSNGYLDMHVIAFYPGGMANWFAPIRAGARAAHVNNLVLKHVATADASRVAPNSPAVCANLTRVSVPNVQVKLGFKGSAAPTLRGATFSVTKSATTTMGAAVSITGEFGGFSVSGTTSTSSSIKIDWPNIPGATNNYFVANSLWYDQETACGDPPTDRFWTLSENSLSSESGTPGAEPISAGHCTLQGPNSSDTYTKGSQQTFSEGANLTAKSFNLDLSVQDGWSSDASITYTTGAVALPLCGVGNVPNGPGAGELTMHKASS